MKKLILLSILLSTTAQAGQHSICVGESKGIFQANGQGAGVLDAPQQLKTQGTTGASAEKVTANTGVVSSPSETFNRNGIGGVVEIREIAGQSSITVGEGKAIFQANGQGGVVDSPQLKGQGSIGVGEKKAVAHGGFVTSPSAQLKTNGTGGVVDIPEVAGQGSIIVGCA